MKIDAYSEFQFFKTFAHNILMKLPMHRTLLKLILYYVLNVNVSPGLLYAHFYIKLFLDL